jgi:glycosyltransferase involved in cell wall biosynthesis
MRRRDGSVAHLPDRSALFVSYSSTLGGAERILLDCATALEPMPLLACPPGPLADAAGRAGVAVLAMRPRSLELRASPRDRLAASARVLDLALELRRVLRERRPELVVAWSMRALLACVPALAGLGPRPRLVFQHNDFLPGPALGALVRAAATSADLTICLSAAIERDLASGGRRLRTQVVHPGVDLERFAPAPEVAGASGAAAGAGHERAPAPVLVLGAIEPWKRPDLALEVAALVPDLRLVVAGEPLGRSGQALLSRLERRAQLPDLRGRVDLCGRLADPLPALREAGALLHCAEREPFGLALVEALACGVPVVAPAAGGPLEIVGAGGRLYPPGDAHAAAAALREVLSPGRRPELAAAARARAEAHFDREHARRRWRRALASA